ncbi:hypothetical protein JK386_17995 [Nocardioides sp. zg-536]|uniref:DUF4913 domain-containing protein n=1 Tax=Nocardioides faecalis TaxID=2803858 RepID=A0A939BZY9_9ACTN|nr:hypothetical protein [Nocardioides faecalis]MBM9461788.1 hypothetical protein [Nocardioides faecalis]QVI60161.1 hypothetical protein KG111_07675 [Nocardioides faecalis]
MGTYEEPNDYRGVADLLERPPESINWNLLGSEDADREWHDLDAWVTWLKVTYGLPPSIVPPYWHRHDELVWELSALHTHWLSCYHESASPSAPIAWMRDFADARHRLRDWVATCGTRLDRDRPTRQTVWPGEKGVELGGEVSIADRRQDFEEAVRADVLRRKTAEAMANRALLG